MPAPGLDRRPGVSVEKVTEIRTIFKDLPAGVGNDGDIAVVVGSETYQSDFTPTLTARRCRRDGGTPHRTAWLPQGDIIDLRDADACGFRARFGSNKDPVGELANRINAQDPGDVFVYVAGHGLLKEDGGSRLSPAGHRQARRRSTTPAYPVQELYAHLGKVGARTIMLMLEANFATAITELVDAPTCLRSRLSTCR